MMIAACAPAASAQDLARLFDFQGGEARFEADRLVAHPKKDLIIATGNVRLRRGETVLLADQVVIDRQKGEARAVGRVRVQTGSRVLLAERMTLELVSMVAVLRSAELYVKEGVTAEALQALTSEPLLRRAGRNLMQVRARRIVKGPGPKFELEDASLSPCDCGDDPPSWKITAPRMSIDPADGAFVERPVFRIGDDGILGLPAAWVPFGERRSGLLQPQVAYTGINGWLGQGSFFWAPTDSFDATPAVEYSQVRGVRPSLELRYAAGPRSDGRLSGAFLFDSALGGASRYNVDGYLRQELAPGVRLSLDLALVSDSQYVSHFAYSLKERSLEYLPSTLALEAARGDHAAFVAADYFQDLQGGGGPRVDLFSSQAGATVHRLPRARYELLPRALGDSPVLMSLQAGVSHFYRTGAAFEDTNGDGAFQPGEAARVYRRVDLGASFSAPLELGGVSLTPRLAYRQLVYDAALPGFPATRGHLVVGGDVLAPFSRVFGAEAPKAAAGAAVDGAPVGSWKHVLEPLLLYRFVPATFERGDGMQSVGPGLGLDELDNLDRAHRLYAGVRTRLVEKTGPLTYSVPFEARLTQGFDLSARALAELRLRTRAARGFFETTLDLSWDPSAGRLDESMVSLTLRDGRGDSLSLSHNYLRGARHERFDLEDLESPLYRGARARTSFLGDLHELTVNPTVRLPIPIVLSWFLQYSFTLKDVVQSVYSARYESPCRCWGLSVSVAQVLGISAPVVGFFLSLTALGSGGAPLQMF